MTLVTLMACVKVSQVLGW